MARAGKLCFQVDDVVVLIHIDSGRTSGKARDFKVLEQAVFSKILGGLEAGVDVEQPSPFVAVVANL